MDTKKILSADVLDIIFDGRNKAYGAYDLRKTYNKRITYALGGTMLVCLLFIVGTILANGKKKGKEEMFVKEIELSKFKEDKPIEKIEQPKPEVKPAEPVKQIAVNVPKIVPDEEVTEDNKPKTIDEIENTRIGSANVDGKDGDPNIIAPPVESKGTGTVEAPKITEDYDKVFTVVQMEATFPGGKEAWTKFLQRNLNSDLPTENGASTGIYSVELSFVVDANGNISDIQVEKDPGYGTKDEAIRILKKSPKWQAAEQNGRKVAYRARQKITFQVSEG
ncbi:energy transducer TonB [Chitinophagaceae bacterium LWZ2-11]